MSISNTHRWKRLAIASATAAIILLIIYTIYNLHSCASIVVDNPVDNVEVVYLKPGNKQFFRIVVSPVNGSYPVAVSVYMWMPNGSIVSLGEYVSRSGVVGLKKDLVFNAYRSWAVYLREHSNNISYFKIGLILLVTVHTPRGVYTIIKSVPLNVYRIVVERTSVEIRIRPVLTKCELTLTSADVRTITIRVLKRLIARKYRTCAGSSEFPPGEIKEYCGSSCAPGTRACVYYCFVWKLKKVYASLLNKGVPLVVAYVWLDSNLVHDVLLREYFEAKESEGIYVSFGITAAVETSSGEISYEVPGFTVQLGGENKVWLDYKKRFWEGIDFTNDALLAIGFRGDMAFAEYKLYYCYASITGWTCLELDKEANMTLARPVIRNNVIEPWYGIDCNPYDGKGLIEKAFSYVQSMWEWSNTYDEQGGLYIDVIEVKNELGTNPLFAASADVLALLVPELRYTLPLAAIAGVTVGEHTESMQYMLLMCDISLKSPNERVIANYFYSPVKFEYKDKRYYIGTLYIDAMIISS